MKYLALAFLMSNCLLIASTANAQDGSRFQQWMEKRKEPTSQGTQTQSKLVQNRPYEIHVPKNLPPAGKRSMIVALHGGSGWAAQFQRGIGLDALADRYSFIVLYLSGTQASLNMAESRLAWNGGSCCGMPARKNVDDVTYILKATEDVAKREGVNPQQIFVTGHSNGAIMSARLMCETNFFQSAALISGALNTHTKTCSAPKGKKLLAIHGEDDENYPYNGGVGSKSVAGTDFVSQQESKSVFEKSGAAYQIILVKNAEHKTDNIDQAIKAQTGSGLPETIVRFFKLDR